MAIIALTLGQTAQGKLDRPPVHFKQTTRILMPPIKGMKLPLIIKWQKRIIRHDKWVIRTAKLHKTETVKWHKAQLKWVQRELKQSLLQQRLLLQSSQSVTLSGVCQSCWDSVASCESHNNWSIISKPYDSAGHTFKGGLQFTDTTWANAGGTRYAKTANLATREQQIAIASTLSLSNWPVCGALY